MCLFYDKTTQSEGGYIADQDIISYKVLLRKPSAHFLRSLYYEEYWALGELKSSPIHVVDCDVLETKRFYNKSFEKFIEGGFYTDSKGVRIALQAIHAQDVIVRKDIGAIEEALYSCTNYMNPSMDETISFFKRLDIVVARCHIPKSSRYYVSDDGETFASDKLVIDGIIKINNF